MAISNRPSIQIADLAKFADFRSSDGLTRGSPVASRSIAHIMADSAEELTFQFSELREQCEKEFDARLVRGSNWARLIGIQKIQELFEQITGESKSTLAEIAKKFLEVMSGSGDAYDAVRKLEGDPTIQYLILREAAQQCARDPILSQKIETAIELVQDDQPGASRLIKADMASAPAAATMTPDVKLRALVRDTYRNALVAADTAAEMALHLLEKYQEAEIPAVIKALARATSADLRSPLASNQPQKLEAILKDLRSIQTINTAFAAANKALRSVVNQGGVVKRSVVRVATDLIRLAHLNPSERFVTDVMLGHMDGEKKVKFGYLASCGQIFNALPSSVWPDEDSKDRWLGCITDYLNREDPRELKAV